MCLKVSLSYYINCTALSGTKSFASDKRKSYDFFFHSIKIVVLRQEVWFAASISRSLSIHWAPDTDDAIQSAKTILTMNAYVALQSCDKAKHLLLKNTRTSVLLSRHGVRCIFKLLRKINENSVDDQQVLSTKLHVSSWPTIMPATVTKTCILFCNITAKRVEKLCCSVLPLMFKLVLQLISLFQVEWILTSG